MTGQAVASSERELQFGSQDDDIDLVPQSPQESEVTAPPEPELQNYGDQQDSNLDSSDPVIFSGRQLQSSDINMLLNAGPCQTTDYSFPVVNNRAFNPHWFNCNMPDKTMYRRKWLSYSKSADRAYCLPCIAFSGPRGSDLWTSTGFCDWHNGARDIQRHECSKEHTIFSRSEETTSRPRILLRFNRRW